MNTGNDRPWKSSLLFLAVLLMTASLIGCGEDDGRDDSGSEGKIVPATSAAESVAEDDASERYREKVNRRVSATVVSSLSREWGVAEAKIECLLADLRFSQLEKATTDTAVASVFDKCGVDPQVTE